MHVAKIRIVGSDKKNISMIRDAQAFEGVKCEGRGI